MATTLVKQNVPQVLGEELVAYEQRFVQPAAAFSDSEGVTYVGFVDPKNPKYTELVAAGLREGDPYMAYKGEFKKLSPFEFQLMDYRQLWVERDQTGKNVIGVTAVDPRNWKSAYKENIEAAVLAFTDVGIIPAVCSFRTTKTEAGHVAIRMLRQATDPNWASKSKDHAETAKFPLPFTRFYIATTTQRDVSKSSGFPFYKTVSTGHLITAPKAAQLQKFLTSPEGKEAIRKTMTIFDNRVQELEKLIK